MPLLAYGAICWRRPGVGGESEKYQRANAVNFGLMLRAQSALEPSVVQHQLQVAFHQGDITTQFPRLAEGGMPDDPAAYVKRVNALLVCFLYKKWASSAFWYCARSY